MSKQYVVNLNFRLVNSHHLRYRKYALVPDTKFFLFLIRHAQLQASSSLVFPFRPVMYQRGKYFWTLLYIPLCRSQWPCGLRHRSAAARLLRLCVRIPPGAWMFVCCDCCVLSGRGFCNELITRPVESYRLWCVVVCDLENLVNERPWPIGGFFAKNKQPIFHCGPG